MTVQYLRALHAADFPRGRDKGKIVIVYISDNSTNIIELSLFFYFEQYGFIKKKNSEIMME